jgi:hypothetical protein
MHLKFEDVFIFEVIWYMSASMRAHTYTFLKNKGDASSGLIGTVGRDSCENKEIAHIRVTECTPH